MVASARPESTVIFLHIPKAAGTTLQWIIERQYDPVSVYHFRWSHLPIDEFNGISETQQKRLRVLTGHMVFGLHELITCPCTYITILRDPVERAISHYYHVLREPAHPHHERVQAMSLDDYVRNGNVIEIDNGQVRRLSGVGTTVDFGECSAEMLAIAKRNLQEHFTTVGLAERFDESLLCMKRALGWEMPFYVKRHVGRNRPYTARGPLLPQATLSLIKETNQLDVELYRYGSEVFDEQIDRHGPSVRELELFRLLNRLFHLYTLPRRAIGRLKRGG